MKPNEFLRDILRYDLDTPISAYRVVERQFEPETVHLFRSARRAGVQGIYVFRTSPAPHNDILPARPVVYFAQARTPQQAREIHCKLWNLGYAPFLIVLLPSQVRVYNAFNYSTQTTDETGLLFDEPLDHARLRDLLADFSADSIDSGRIWHSSYARQMDVSHRIDERLLSNLKALAKALVEDKENPLPAEIAYALIGKYIYIRYLRDRRILSPEWLVQNDLNLDNVLGRGATVDSLCRLTKVLENRFNGDVFPINFSREVALQDSHVSLVASVFKGDEPKSSTVLQAYLDFKYFEAYDFQYIPIETLSSIYELFLHAQDRGREVGAFYTPEILADYVISEVQSVRQLTRETKILDPSCGSGVFLVLAYRRLIELELANQATDRLTPEELRDILLESIYGVEREANACSVTELSLILTLLDYVDPPELHKNTAFKLPNLRDKRIFKCDFFDNNSKFWRLGHRFNWIVGNPPWVELKNVAPGEELFVRQWIEENKTSRPVARGRVAEAFSWRVVDLLDTDGVVGLIHHATSLFNKTSREYRKTFFQKHEVFRITNFANLRGFLFKGRAGAPAATFIYHRAADGQEKLPIIHYGPFYINQVPGIEKDLWIITINENEIQVVLPHEAESGDASVWKFALWGTGRDKRAIERLRHLFPMTLADLCEKKGWPVPAQGSDLRNISEVPITKQDGLEFKPELVGKLLLESNRLNREPHYLFSIPQYALEENRKHHIRTQGGEAGLKLTNAPHIYLAATWNHIIYSERDFVIPARQIGIAATSMQDADYLRALALYLRSSFVTYYIFFQVPEWGVFLIGAKIVVMSEVKKIPVPDFTPGQVQQLANLHRELVREEQRAIKTLVSTDDLHARLQEKLDKNVFEILDIPKNLYILAREFVETRLPLDQGIAAVKKAKRPPSDAELSAYACILKDELDGFMGGRLYHKVKICRSAELIECVVEMSQIKDSSPVSVQTSSRKVGEIMSDIRNLLGEWQSQWVYVQRGLRVFDGPRAHIYKLPYLVEWTRTQALNDATDFISEVLSMAETGQ